MATSISCKVVLVGEAGSGKTSIIKSFIHSSLNKNETSTLNATYYNKVLEYENNKRVVFDIWDTNGQEKFRSVTKHFYINASIGILVYDITSKHSFQQIKDFWYKELEENGEDNLVIAIVGNKIDKFYEEQVTEDEGREYADSVKAIFHLTSCVQQKGIHELFKKCGERYLDLHRDKNEEKEEEKNKVTLKQEKHKEESVKKKKRRC